MSFFEHRRSHELGMLAAPALLATALLAALAGCGEGSGGSTQASVPSASSTGASTATVHTGSTGAAKTSTSSSKATTSSSSQAPAKGAKTAAPGSSTHSSDTATSRPTSGPVLRSFAGSGNTRLGTISVSSSELLVWSAQRAPIQIFTTNGFILVSGRTRTGSVRLARGTYAGVRVATRGGWSIQLHALS
jgi:hypothetical protein